MLGSKTVLIVDENGYAALDLSEAIVESDGRVGGPAATLSETLTILDSTCVCGAVVDCELADAFDVVMLLTERDVPIVVQISGSFAAWSGGFKREGKRPRAASRSAHDP